MIVWHRRARKTTCAINQAIKWAIENPGKIIWYVAPSYRQAKDIVWTNPEMLFKYLPLEIIEKKNEVELTIWLKNKSIISLKGVDNPDALRGQNVNYVLFDEYGEIASRWGDLVWEQIIRPILEANNGKAWFLGTPKGQNHFYSLYLKGKQGLSDWQSWLLPATESGIFTAEQLERLKHEMPQAYFNQEFMCEFLESASAVFRRIDENIYEKMKPSEPTDDWHLGVDLAKYQDWTVITPINLMTFYVGDIIRVNKVDWVTQKAIIQAEYLRKNKARIKIDATGVGDPIIDDLKKAGVTVRDEDAIKFTEATRENLLKNLAVLLEQDKIKIPNYEPLINELKAFQYVLKGNKIRMEVPAGMTDDCVVSLALAVKDLPNKPRLRKSPPKILWDDDELKDFITYR